MRSFQILQGDALERLSQLESGSVQVCVTSPPYWGLRNYGTNPKVWGGESSCEHTWIDAAPRRQRSPEDVKNLESIQAGNVGTLHILPSTALCSKCGAWLGEFGLEPTPELYIAHLVQIFREVKRVLRSDGVLWLNLGDSYIGGKGQSGSQGAEHQEARNKNQRSLNKGYQTLGGKKQTKPTDDRQMLKESNLKPKDLVGIPWMAAFALRADGWYLRSDIIWAKPNPMPESVEDRPTKSHEYIFLLTKSAKYFYDAEAIKEEAAYDGRKDTVMKGSQKYADGFVPNQSEQTFHARGHERWQRGEDGEYLRNKRSVWTVNTHPFSEAHFAVFPPKLIEPCILAGTSEKGCCEACGAPYQRIVERTAMVINRSTRGVQMGEFGKTAASGNVVEPASSRTIGWQASCKHNSSIIPCTVLDPFCGSGTSGLVSLRHNRNFIGIELNPEYVEMARNRITNDAPLFNEERVA